LGVLDGTYDGTEGKAFNIHVGETVMDWNIARAIGPSPAQPSPVVAEAKSVVGLGLLVGCFA
jgi:hypothetical protein